MEHAMQCLKRLIKIILGEAAVKDEKCDWGEELEMLGVYLIPETRGVKGWPSVHKVCAPLYIVACTALHANYSCRFRSGCE